MELNNTKAIRKWIGEHEYLQPVYQSEEVNIIGELYGVAHTLYLTESDWQAVTLRRIYRADNLDHALAKYVFGSSRHRSGRGTEYVDMTIRDNFNWTEQKIEVFPLAKGTDRFY